MFWISASASGPEDVDVRGGAREDVAQRPLELGLLRGVIVVVGGARGEVLGEPGGIVGVKAVGGDRGGVDQSPRPGGDGGLEDVARAFQIDAA